jgi:Mrp family chromosome partitioning ATPase
VEGDIAIMKNARRPTGEDGAAGSVYHTLIYSVFQRPRESEDDAGAVVALTSCNPDEGVTHITRGLARELAACESASVARIDARFLRRLHEPTIETLQQSLSRSPSNISEIGLADTALVSPKGGTKWDASWQYRRDCIDLLRREFDYALVDCSSLKESGDLLSLAPFVDGVVLVVEANRTRRSQILHAERTIQAARGTLLGHILNKRTYPVPWWLYQLT